MKPADYRLGVELKHSADQLQEQFRAAQRQEQLAQAYLVQVTNVRTVAFPEDGDDPGEKLECAAAVVVNHGRYTITRIGARIFEAGSITSYSKTRFRLLICQHPDQFCGKGTWETDGASSTTLTPMGVGIEYETGRMAKKFLIGSCSIVRWQDHWGTWWEHKKGVVREIADGEQWIPRADTESSLHDSADDPGTYYSADDERQ